MTSTLAPALDVNMEVSSPAGNQFQDEVLIDYEYDGMATFTEDEQMLEDGEAARPGTATDDMMEDDEPTATVHEEIMHDDPVTVAPDSYIEDEELIDYSDEDDQDDTEVAIVDANVHAAEVRDNSFVASTDNVAEHEHVNPTPPQQEDAAAVQESTAHVLSATTEAADKEQEAGIHASEEAAAAAAAAAEDSVEAPIIDREDVEAAAARSPEEQVPETYKPVAQESVPSDNQQVHDATEVFKQPPRFPAGLDTTGYSAPDGPATPSDTGLHPITVRYGDFVMPLFKSRAQPDGLLKNDNLASLSLGALLDNCRHRIAVKIGESVSADQELVLSFENMGLQLVEHSPQAFETSLDDVLQVYLRLHQNDSRQVIPPLAVALTLQLKFTSSFNILKAAAEQGEGMSKFAYLRDEAEEVDDYVEDEEAEQYEGNEDAEFQYREAADEEQYYEGEEDFAQALANAEVSHLEQGQEYEEDRYQENPEANQEDEADQHHDGRHDETSYEEYEEEHLADLNEEELGQYDDDNRSLEGSTAVHDESAYLVGTDPELEADDSGVQAVQEREEPVQPESTASSTTVRGDAPNDTNGEYDDFIDFEDDGLTSNPAELHEDDGTDELSALGSEYDDHESAAATATAESQEHVAEAAVGTGDTFAFHLHSGDSLAQSSNDTGKEENATGQAQYNPDVDQQEQHDDTPADTLDPHEEEDVHGPADENFEAAFDLLDDHDFENGAEETETAKATNVADDLDFGDDDIGFNDDVEEVALAPNSPLGKRSFDEHVGEDDGTQQQELKRARSG